jgi:glycosyltransferase involved in cell wall biosynthesis
MLNAPKYSIVIPVYNRPDELNELLFSLTNQSFNDFEVIVVEDGSSIKCDDVVKSYLDTLSVLYLYKQNEGPGPARNFGYRHAKGQYLVVFDSDCIIPSSYFDAVEKSLALHQYDAWGGPDRAHENFTLVQRAMGYTMSSVLTTGGIRGGKKRVGWFQPRSFNMGISRTVYDQTGGFKFDRFAEDIEFSIRMKMAGFKVGLIEDAYVFHKRRTTFLQFFKQVFNFGKGRALIGRIYPNEIKLTHWFPTVFTFTILFLFASVLIHKMMFGVGLFFFALYLFAIFIHSLLANRNFFVAILSVPSALFQLVGYGSGFFKERVKSYFRD